MFSVNDDFELSDIGHVFDESRLPFGLMHRGKKELLFKQMSDWIEKRGLPCGRTDLPNIEYDLNVKNPVQLTLGSYALNLADHYWVHKSGLYIRWNKVNFFQNNFKEVINFDCMGVYKQNKNIRIAPDLTVDGCLRKKWIVSGFKRYLLKGSLYYEMQEPFNEVIASKIMKILGIDHVQYKLIRNKKSNDIPLSVCKCMVTKNTEFISAHVVRNMESKLDRNEYDRFIQICRKNGIQNAKEKIDNMIIIDYIIGNTDRHAGNFGIIRNADTLEWLDVAPLFDNGNSFCHSVRTITDIEYNIDTACRWLGCGNYAALQYIDYPQWFTKYTGEKIVDIIHSNFKYNRQMSEDKKSKLVSIVQRRIQEFEKLLEKNKQG